MAHKITKEIDDVLSSIYNIKTLDISELIYSYIANPQIKKEIEICNCCIKKSNNLIVGGKYIQSKNLLFIVASDCRWSKSCAKYYCIHIYTILDNVLHYLISYYLERIPEMLYDDLYRYESNILFEKKGEIYLWLKYLESYTLAPKVNLVNLSLLLDDFIINFNDKPKVSQNTNENKTEESHKIECLHNKIQLSQKSKYNGRKMSGGSYCFIDKESIMKYSEDIIITGHVLRNCIVKDDDIVIYNLIDDFYETYKYPLFEKSIKNKASLLHKIDNGTSNYRRTKILGEKENHLFIKVCTFNNDYAVFVFDLATNKLTSCSYFQFKPYVERVCDNNEHYSYRDIQITNNGIYISYLGLGCSYNMMNLLDFQNKKSDKFNPFTINNDRDNIIHFNKENTKNMCTVIIEGDTFDICLLVSETSLYIKNAYVIK